MESSYIMFELIKNRLIELLPGFSYNGIDSKLYDMIIEDFINYLKYRWRLNIESFVPLTNPDDEMLNEDKRLHVLFTTWLESDPEKSKEEIDAWVSLWLCKWKGRVQILFGEENLYNRNFNQVQDVIKRGVFARREIFKGVKEELEFKKSIIFTLLSYEEIVGTNLLAETIISKVSNRIKYHPEGIEGRLKFLNDCMREAKDMSATPGKIIFVSVKNFNWKFES
jgi:hypothetical protein